MPELGSSAGTRENLRRQGRVVVAAALLAVLGEMRPPQFLPKQIRCSGSSQEFLGEMEWKEG